MPNLLHLSLGVFPRCLIVQIDQQGGIGANKHTVRSPMSFHTYQIRRQSIPQTFKDSTSPRAGYNPRCQRTYEEPLVSANSHPASPWSLSTIGAIRSRKSETLKHEKSHNTIIMGLCWVLSSLLNTHQQSTSYIVETSDRSLSSILPYSLLQIGIILQMKDGVQVSPSWSGLAGHFSS